MRRIKIFSVSDATRNMGRLFARTKRGEIVLLRHGEDTMQLVEPIPQRPVGYFVVSEEGCARINAQPDDEAPPL